MFIVSGTNSKEKKLGFTAEFCQTCQAINPFLVHQMSVGDHLYFLPFGSSKVTAHHATCQVCKVRVDINAVSYCDYVKNPGYDLNSLINTTFPKIREIHSGRLALARILHEGKLESSEREVMLTDFWRIFAGHVEEATGKGLQLGGKGGWGLIFTFGMAAIMAISTFWLPAAWHGDMFQALGILVVVGVIYSVIQMALDPGRVSRDILGRLAVGLKPFDTTREEIDSYLDRLKRAGYKLGRKVKADALISAIAALDGARHPLKAG